MPPETYLAKKLRELGLSSDGGNGHKKLQFRLYFPRPPYGDVEYSAVKHADGLNFVGQLLGHGGSTLQRIQRESGVRIEIHDSKGNLNGTHPDCADQSVHALVFADSREKLAKAVRQIAEVVSPVNAVFERFEVVAGGSAVLRPKIPGRGTSVKPPAVGGPSTAWGGVRRGVLAQGRGDEGSVHSTKSQETGNPARPPVALPLGKTWAEMLRQPETSSQEDSATRTAGETAVSNQKNSLEHSVTLGSGRASVEQPVSDGASETLSDAKSAELGEQVSGGVSEDGGVMDGPTGRGWDAWGRDKAEPYNQFTSATRSLVTEFANRSREMKKQQQQARQQSLFVEAIPSAVNLGEAFPCAKKGSDHSLFMASAADGHGAAIGKIEVPKKQMQDTTRLQGRQDGVMGTQMIEEQRLGNINGTPGGNFGAMETIPSKICSHSNICLDQGQREEVNQFVNLLKIPLP